MARRPSLIKIKQKHQKKSKTEQYLINRKYLGEEPVVTSKEMNLTQLNYTYTWYNYMSDLKEAKEYLLTYLKNTGRDKEAKRLKEIPDKWMPTTAAWQARLMSRGANLPEKAKEFFELRLKECFDRDYTKKYDASDGEEEATAPKKVKLTVQDRMSIIYDSLVCEIEEEIDNFVDTWNSSLNMYEWLQGKEVSTALAKRMLDYYNPILIEIEEAFEGICQKKQIDEQLKEGYSSYGKEKLTKLFGFYVMIVEDLEQYVNNAKKQRKPRAKKPISAEKKLKDFKYLSFDSEKKIQSAQPELILSSSELWTFSTKYNQLTVFRSLPGGTLDVHRTAIINYDPVNSETKKLKAKDVDSVLKEVQSGGKVTLRNLMKNIRGSKQKIQERMNDKTLLLRIVSK